MSVLITGGCGFVGIHLAVTLQEMGHRVTVYDNLGRWGEEHLPSRCEIVPGDILDESLLAFYVAKSNTVYHLAVVNITESSENPARALAVNVAGTECLLRSAAASGVRVVFTSSASVYGNGEVPSVEWQELDILTPYAASKAAAERYCQLYMHKIPITILRYSNIYGPDVGGGVLSYGVVSKFMEGDPVIYGDGDDTRDYVYIDDAVNLTIRASRNDCRSATINVGTGVETSTLDLARMIAPDRPIDFQPGRKVDVVRRRCLVSSRANILGWNPRPLSEGLAFGR